MNPADEQAIRELAREWAGAWSRHDMPAMHALMTEDAELVTVAGAHWQGREQIQQAHTRLHRQQLRHSVWQNLAVEVQALAADLALAHVRWQMQGELAADDTPKAPREVIVSWVLVRSAGGWHIRAGHTTNVLPPA